MEHDHNNHPAGGDFTPGYGLQALRALAMVAAVLYAVSLGSNKITFAACIAIAFTAGVVGLRRRSALLLLFPIVNLAYLAFVAWRFSSREVTWESRFGRPSYTIYTILFGSPVVDDGYDEVHGLNAGY